MKLYRRLIAALLSVSMILPVVSGTVTYAEGNNSVSISNDYMTFSVNKDTGFFTISTLDGHPQKAADDNMNLIYEGDSIETSFTTVRIDGEDYVFGQNYGIFGTTASLGSTDVDLVENTLTTSWSIKGLTIKQIAYLSRTDNTITSGNVKLAYTVENKSSSAHNVGIRVMLDNSLGAIDAPVTLVQSEISPIAKETKFFDGDRDPGAYIRYIDNYDIPSKESYISFDDSISDTPSSLIVGHWYNLASTMWEYEPDTDMSFSTGFNSYGTADTATALYWDERDVSAGGSFSRAMLYGVGDFSTGGTNGNFNIALEIDDGNLVVGEDGNYTDPTVNARLTVYNNVDDSVDLNGAILNAASEDGAFFVYTGEDKEAVGFQTAIKELGFIAAGSVQTFDFKMAVNVPEELKAIKVTASVMGNSEENTSEATAFIVAPAKEKSQLLFATESIAQDKYHKSNNRVMMLTGTFNEDMLEDRSKWAVAFVSKTDSTLRYEISSEKITVIDDKSMMITYDGDMVLDNYEIEFSFFDDYKELFGSKFIGPSFMIVYDEKLVTPEYGIVAVIRLNTGISSHYQIISADTDDQLKKAAAAADAKEILLTLRGSFKKDYDEDGVEFYTALGDFTVNDVAVGVEGSVVEYCSKMGGTYKDVRIDGKDKIYSAGKKHTIINASWMINVEEGFEYSLAKGNVKLELGTNALTSALLQLPLGLFNAKYGVFGKHDGEYTISYGGTLSLAGYQKDNTSPDAGKNPMLGRAYMGVNLCIDLKDVMFGKDGFIGINTTAKFSVAAADVLGCAQKDMFAITLKINTIDNDYYGEILVTLGKKMPTTVKMGVGFAELNLPDDSMIIPDDFVLNVAVPPKMASTQIAGIAGVYMADFELYDVASAIEIAFGDTPNDMVKKANAATSEIKAGIGIVFFAELLLMGYLDLGINHAYISLTGTAADVPGLTATGTLKLAWKLQDNNLDGTTNVPRTVSVGFSFDINAFDIIKAGASVSYTHKNLDDFWDSNIFSLNIYGAVYIPKRIPFFGGIEVLGASGTIDNSGILMYMTLVGVDMGLSYSWDVDDFSFFLASEGNIKGNEEAINLNNMRYLPVKKNDIELMSVENYVGGEIECDEGYSEVLCARFVGNSPDISELSCTIDGADYPLTECDTNGQNGNTMVIPDDGEGGRILIGIPNPPSGKHNYKVLSSGTTALANLEAGGFKKMTTAKELKQNSDGSVTVKADKSLKGGKVDVYYIKDKTMYDNIQVEEYTDSEGNEKVRAYKMVDGQKIYMDENFYDRFPEQIVASADVSEDVTEVTLTPEFKSYIQSGDYYIMAAVTSPEGKVTRVVSEEPFTFENIYQPDNIKSVTISDAGDKNIAVSIEDADNINYTGYSISLYNETDNEYAIESMYFAKDSDIIIKDFAEDGKQYHVEVNTVNQINDEESCDSSDAVRSNSITVHKPQSIDVKISLENELIDGIYTNTDGTRRQVSYIKGGDLKLRATAPEAVKGRFVLNDAKGPWITDLENGAEETVSQINPGLYTAYFEGVNSLGDTTKSERVTFAVGTGKPSVTLYNSVLTPANGKITVSGIAQGVQKVKFGESEYTVGSDGSFEFTADAEVERYAKRYEVTAVGYDGQTSTVSLYAINPDAEMVKSITLLSDGEDKDIVTVRPGDSIALSVNGNADTVTYDMADDAEVRVCNGNNLVSLSGDNELTALSTGKAYIKALYNLGTVMDDDGNETAYAYEDMLEVNITDRLSKPQPSIPNGASIKFGEKLSITADGDIYYTLDGSEPTTNSIKYTEPITLKKGTVTVKAISVKQGWEDSEVAEWTYKVSGSSGGSSSGTTNGGKINSGKITASVSSEETLDYGSPVTLTTDSGVIYYTTDGTTPDKNSQKYDGPLTVTKNEKIRAVVWNEGDIYSDVYEYDIKLNPYGIFIKKDMTKGMLMTGYEDGTFRPDNAITRAEAATVLRNATDMYGYYIDENRFPDVEMWAKQYINELASAGVISGYEDGTFRPDDNVTRAEFVTMLMLIAGENGTKADYTDTDGHWAESYIAKASEYGFISGYEDGTFRPDNPITRAEAMVIMSKIFSLSSDGTVSSYPDVTESHWAFGYIAE